MRYHAGRSAYWQYWEVYVDGARMPLCLIANDQTGEAWCARRAPGGVEVGADGRPLLDYHRGRVEIRAKRMRFFSVD